MTKQKIETEEKYLEILRWMWPIFKYAAPVDVLSELLSSMCIDSYKTNTHPFVCRQVHLTVKSQLVLSQEKVLTMVCIRACWLRGQKVWDMDEGVRGE